MPLKKEAFDRIAAERANYQQQLQANIEHLQMQCKPQLMTVRYTKLPTTINRPRKSVKF